MRISLQMLLAACLSFAVSAAEHKKHDIQKLAEDVYLFSSLEAGITSNTLVVINKDDVLLVDSHSDPRGATQLLDDLKSITAKQVKYVVNTHFHFDHMGGNEIFGPNVEVIGSVFTRHQLTHRSLQGRTASLFFAPGGTTYYSQTKRVEDLKRSIAGETDAVKAAALQKELSEVSASNASVAKAIETPPTIVVPEKLVLHRGEREIQIIHPGRGHTGGDLLVYLPKERVVATGDFLLSGPYCCGFMGDFYPGDYPASIDRLKALDFDTLVPGHGPIMTGAAAHKQVAAWQNYLRDFWSQVTTFKKQRLSALDASRKLDMTRHKADLPASTGPADFQGDQPLEGVVRAYELLEGSDYYEGAPH